MYSSMIKSIIFLVIISYSNTQLMEKGCRMSQFDSKIKQATKLTSEGVWPTNEQDVDKICKSYPQIFTESRNFVKKCAKGESKTILGISIHSMEKMSVKLYCRGKNAKKERNKLIEASKCTNTASKASVNCWNKMIMDITYTANSSNSEDKMPLLCCSLLLWKDCFLSVYTKIGAPKCNPEQIEYLDQFLYKSMIDPMNIFCSEYEDSDKCSKFSDFLSKSSSLKVKYATPFPSIKRLFENL